VDADGDGEPDTVHDTSPGELATRPGADVEHVGPVVEAELLDEIGERSVALRRLMQDRPVVPVWLREPARGVEAVRWVARYASYRAGFHAMRAPVYLTRLYVAAPRGVGRVAVGWGRWVSDAEARPLREAMVAQNDTTSYLLLCKQRNQRVKIRAVVSLIGVVVLPVGVLVTWTVAPVSTVLVLLGIAALLGVVGRRPDRPIITPVVAGQKVTKLTTDIVERAYIAANLASENNRIGFPQPIQRLGQGWLAVLDLPYGRTFREAAKKREAIASGLNVNLVTVFLDPDPVSARRVRMWVSDIDVFAQKPVPSPLIKAGRFDFWQPVPFGVDARDRLITLPLVFSSLLVGAIPRMGKTFSARLPCAAAALDPHVRLLIFNGKGCTAWRAFQQVAHAYGSGVRDEIMELLVASLTELVADMNARFDRMSQLPTEACPDAKLTPALARNRRLNMPLTVVAIDEVQRYLEHPEHGATILELLVDLVKVGPAAGIMLILATQKPDAKVVPDSLRGQIGSRFAMRVMTYQASETILGAGTYSAGMDASKFSQAHKGVGILLGADDSELSERGGQDVRTHLLSGKDLDAVCERGRALRESEGLLTGMAAGETPTRPRTLPVLDDVARAFPPGADKAWSETLVSRLAELDPASYDGWTAAQLATALKPYGITPGQVWATGEDGKAANRRGYMREAIVKSLADRLDHP
jgi:DNA segregation ATPase FtsK/SpoIIIE, S-DNA-T family